jgi:hypothetical protein
VGPVQGFGFGPTAPTAYRRGLDRAAHTAIEHNFFGAEDHIAQLTAMGYRVTLEPAA